MTLATRLGGAAVAAALLFAALIAVSAHFLLGFPLGHSANVNLFWYEPSAFEDGELEDARAHAEDVHDRPIGVTSQSVGVRLTLELADHEQEIARFDVADPPTPRGPGHDLGQRSWLERPLQACLSIPFTGRRSLFPLGNRLPEEVLDLAVDASQVSCGPLLKFPPEVGRDAQEEGFALLRWHVAPLMRKECRC